MSQTAELQPARAVLVAREVTKSFGGTLALHDAQIELYPGEVHALLGENGAGKSTLIKIITGLHHPDRGEILIDGEPVVVSSPADAQRQGIVAIYQEPLDLPRPVRRREHLHRTSRSWSSRQLATDAARRLRDPRPARRPPRSDDTGERVDGRRATGDRDRQGDVAGRARADHGRADRRPVRPRGAASVPSGRSAQGVGRGGAVHQPPPRRGLRDRRPDHRVSRWAPHLDPADARHERGTRRPGDGRPRARRLLRPHPHAER